MTMKNIDANTLKLWVDKNEAVLVDVREPGEHKAESIPKSTLVPLARVSKAAMPDTNGKKLVMHCQSGKRAGMACEKLQTENPATDVYNLEGGIAAWKQAGLEVKRSGGFFLPLDRQVQLTIGSFVLVGSLLGYYVSPSYFLLSGFFGCGLIFAGLSGYCGLAMVMAKMPWNQSGASACAMK